MQKTKPDNTRFYWTLTGTNDVPDGTGKKVKISGYEEWSINNVAPADKYYGKRERTLEWRRSQSTTNKTKQVKLF